MARSFTAGASEYLNVTSNLGLTDYPFTMACWGLSRDLTIDQAFMSLYNASLKHYILLWQGATTGDPIRFSVRNGVISTVNIDTTTGYSANTWHHACGVCAASNDHRIFIDGGSKATSSINVPWISPTDFLLGQKGNTTLFVDGRIAHASVWDVALTDAEVAQLARGVMPFLIRPASIRAYYPLGGHDNNQRKDYDLTQFNDPKFGNGPPMIHRRRIMRAFAHPPAAGAGQPAAKRIQTVPHMAGRQW